MRRRRRLRESTTPQPLAPTAVRRLSAGSRAAVTPGAHGPLTATTLAELQRNVGNSAVARLVDRQQRNRGTGGGAIISRLVDADTFKSDTKATIQKKASATFFADVVQRLRAYEAMVAGNRPAPDRAVALQGILPVIANWINGVGKKSSRLPYVQTVERDIREQIVTLQAPEVVGDAPVPDIQDGTPDVPPPPIVEENQPVVVPPPPVPHVVVIEGESVNLTTDLEEAEARRLIAKFSNTYGVTLNSAMTITAIKASYGSVPASEKAKLKTATWEMKELRAVDAALAHFAPILGKERKSSTLGKKAQGVTSIGRVEEAIDEDSKHGVVEEGTMGEYFKKKKNVGLFNTVTDLEDDRYVREGSVGTDNETTLEANAIHEMSHGLIEPIFLKAWIKAMSYWDDQYNASGEVGAEEPPTEYGHSAASEDMAESVAIFFVNRPGLAGVAPEREKFIADMIAGWSKPTKKAAVRNAKKSKGSGD